MCSYTFTLLCLWNKKTQMVASTKRQWVVINDSPIVQLIRSNIGVDWLSENATIPARV